MPSLYLELKNLTRVYGRTAAVDQLSLRLSKGELLVLLGPSGCGKTTTLRLLAGLETATAGEIFLNGKSLNRVRPQDRNVAMVFQDHTLYPHMRVAENLGFSLKMQGLGAREIRARVQETAGALGLEEHLSQWPHQLSGGEAQRVALGKALIRRPDLLLLDEPLSNLDPPLRRKLRDEIRSLQRRYSITAIHVTHDQEEAMALGGRIGIMNKGRLLQTATPKEIYDSPTCVFGAQFLGSPPINLLEAEHGAGEGVVHWPPGGLDGMNIPFPVSLLSNRGVGRTVLVGVRPEHVLVSVRSKSPPELHGRVDLVQDMGFEYHLLVECGGERLRVRCSRLPEGVREGVEVYVKIRTENALLFDRETGERLPAEFGTESRERDREMTGT
jgi:ABC-type sugar transport system ATPase subunit